MATTVKNYVRGLIKNARATMKDKTLPKAVHDALEALSAALGKTWTDLEADAEGDNQDVTEALRGEVIISLLESVLKKGESLTAMQNLVQQALNDKFKPAQLSNMEYYSRPWVRDWFDDMVVYDYDARLWQIAYTIDKTSGTSEVILGDPVEVEVVYQPIGGATMMSEAVTKREQGKDFPAGDYAYVPDPELSSTWKLRLTATPGGDPDPAIVGAAIAALGKGFRGQKVDIPAADKPGVMKKVRAAWKKANPDKSMDMMPATIKEAEPPEDTEYQIDFVPLLEKAVHSDGTMPVKIIQPGWGSSGYYSPQVLERAAQSKVFSTGLKMYWNHPTLTEDAERPERDLRDLAAELVSDARWVPNHQAGPGLYADAKVFNPFTEAVDQLAPHIGVSIRALGKAEAGQAEGKSGPIIKEISSARSVDFVTEPGAGGQILSLFEARRGAAQSNTQEGDENMGELDELKTANAQLQKELNEHKAVTARLLEAELLREAEKIAGAELAKVDLPIITRTRLVAQLTRQAPIKEGRLDAVAFDTLIKAAVSAETAYLVEVTGGGQITGMGGTQPAEPKPEEVEASLAESFQRLGLSEKTAKIAAKGRN